MSTLAEKIVAAALKVGGALATDKRNTQQAYDYISADKILSVCGQALAEQGVAVFPSVTHEETTVVETGNGKHRYDVSASMVFTVADEKAQIELPFMGRGSDYSVPDKAFYKAVTSGHKYFLMKLLCVGAGNEDGEHEVEPVTPPALPSRVTIKVTERVPLSNHAEVNFGLTVDSLKAKLAGLADNPKARAGSEKQYNYIGRLIDDQTKAKGSHSHVLDSLLGGPVSAEDPPNSDVSTYLIEKLAPQVKDKDSGAFVANMRWDADAARCIREVWEEIRESA